MITCLISSVHQAQTESKLFTKVISGVDVKYYLCFYYRKQELYSLEWGDLIDLSKFVVVAAPYGGPVGKEISLTLNTPIATKVVCFSRLLKCLKSLYCKQCGPRYFKQ